MEYAKALCGSQQTGKFLKRQNTRLPDLPPEKSSQVEEATVRTGQEQQTGSKWGKEYVTAVCLQPAYLTHMQRTS